MKLEILTPEELKKAYETDLSEAFPPSELKPLSAMESLRERGVYDPLCLRDEAGAVGLYPAVEAPGRAVYLD